MKLETSTMTLWEELNWRGLVYQTTITDTSIFEQKTITFYHGFDASSDSQTIGNLAAMMLDLCLLRHGHKAIVLAGGATSLIGDPGGKDSERVLQSMETIAHNVTCAEQQLMKIYGNYEFTLVNNIDWTCTMSVLDFLRDIGKHFNVGEMIKRDYIADRIGTGGNGISFTEFSYSLLQGLDFLHLYRTYGCTLQLGGSDQWSNCLSGVELIRKKENAEVHVITLPLIINRATGKKFGKSEAGAVWLSPEKTSPYEFYQFWYNVDDVSVAEYIKIFTDILPDGYDALMAEFTNNTASRGAQRFLARSVTSLVHSTDIANQTESVSRFLFGETKLNDLKPDELALLLETITTVPFDPEKTLVEYLLDSRVCESKRAARELISANAVSLNETKITDESYVVTQSDFINNVCLIRKGKREYFGIVIN